MTTFTRTRTGTSASAVGKITLIERLALETFGFLLPFNQPVTGEQFAARIERAYSVGNPRTLAVVSHLRGLT